MKPHDKRRLNAMIKDEEMGEREYTHMADEMHKVGHHVHENVFRKMAADEARHANNIRKMMAGKTKFKGVRGGPVHVR